MSKIFLTKEILNEILSKQNDSSLMEYYYQECLNDNVVAYQREGLIALLLILLNYKWSNLFAQPKFSVEYLLNLKNIKDNNDINQYSELLSKTNLEIGLSIIDNDLINDKVLIEFKNMFATYLLVTNQYLGCLAHCDNVIFRDPNDSTANFYKAILTELCLAVKSTPEYKFKLSIYQKELLNKCKIDEIQFDKRIVNQVYEDIKPKFLPPFHKFMSFTLIDKECTKSEEYKKYWTDEDGFYLRNKLFLNPLNDFGNFAESLFETFEELPISKEHRVLFDSIVEDYKYGRNKLFKYSVEDSICDRDMISTYSFIYSIFDKIAYLFWNVYNLNIAADSVSFTQNGLFDVKIKGTNKCFYEINNPAIIPLYYLMKKARTRNKITNPLQVGTFELNEYRNGLEHKTSSGLKKSELITNSKFLLGYVREAIIYSYLLLHGADVNTNSDDITCIGTTYMKSIFERSKK